MGALPPRSDVDVAEAEAEAEPEPESNIAAGPNASADDGTDTGSDSSDTAVDDAAADDTAVDDAAADDTGAAIADEVSVDAATPVADTDADPVVVVEDSPTHSPDAAHDDDSADEAASVDAAPAASNLEGEADVAGSQVDAVDGVTEEARSIVAGVIDESVANAADVPQSNAPAAVLDDASEENPVDQPELGDVDDEDIFAGMPSDSEMFAEEETATVETETVENEDDIEQSF